MTTYLRQLALKTVGAGVLSLTALALAAEPFDVLTFDWSTNLTVAGSASVLALLEGLAGRFTGDKDQASVAR